MNCIYNSLLLKTIFNINKEYYIKNKEDLILYGSKKYDLLTIDKLVQEMKQYKNSILEKINQNPNKFKLKNYGLQNSNQNLILTPLAQKERSKMGSNEKELFNLAERRGVVMRRIEYTNSLSGGGGLGLDMKIFFIMKDAVKMIEKFWILHKEGKNRKIKKFVELLDKYIALESDKDIKEELVLLQDKIKGVYIGSKQEEKELNLKDENGKKYNILTRAIKEKRKVKILYYSYDKGENERGIDPAEMFLFQDGWYCAAFCEKKQDIRHFELKRIRRYELLDEKFE